MTALFAEVKEKRVNNKIFEIILVGGRSSWSVWYTSPQQIVYYQPPTPSSRKSRTQRTQQYEMGLWSVSLTHQLINCLREHIINRVHLYAGHGHDHLN